MRKLLLALAAAILSVWFLGPFGTALADKPVDGKHNHGGGDGDPTGATLNVTFCLVSDTSCVSTTTELHFHVTVTHADVPVKGAKVVVTVTDESDLSWVLRQKTGSDGVAHFEKKNPGPPEPGTYILSIEATKDEASGSCSGLRILEDASGKLFEEVNPCPALP